MPNNPRTQKLLFAAAILLPSPSFAALPPMSPLPPPVPVIYAAYYPLYAGPIRQYARTQGFTEPAEEKGIVTHELIHIAQAHKGGFYLPDDGGVDGKRFMASFVGPYITDPVWASFRMPSNKEVIDATTQPSVMDGKIPRNYGMVATANTFPNLVDEINAYRLTAPWICRHAGEAQCAKQRANLSGMLDLAARHLKYYRERYPLDAMRFAKSDAKRLSFGIIAGGMRALESIKGAASGMESEGAVW